MKQFVGMMLGLWLSGLAHAGAGLDALAGFLDGLNSLEAGFEQTVLDTENNRTGSYQGVFFLQRPGRFRWNYLSPYEQAIIADGDYVWVIDDLEQVTQQGQERALRGTPALLLVGDEPMEKHFEATEVGKHLGMEWIELIPRDPEGHFERIQMAFLGGELNRMEMRDRYGQITRFRFFGLQRNKALDPDLFKFESTDGYDVFAY